MLQAQTMNRDGKENDIQQKEAALNEIKNFAMLNTYRGKKESQRPDDENYNVVCFKWHSSVFQRPVYGVKIVKRL